MSLLEMLVLGAVGTGLSSYWLTGRIRRYAVKHLLDVPNSRSSHAIPTPRGGGLAIVLSCLLAFWVWDRVVGIPVKFLWALAGVLPIAAIGFWDDHGHVPARLRMLVHVGSAIWSVGWLGDLKGLALLGIPLAPTGLAWALAVFSMVWMVNLFNFMDGIDGVASSEAIFVSAAAAGLSWHFHPELLQGPVFALFAMACLGFLIWNWPPAKIFMGDVASGSIGFVLGIFVLMAATKGGPNLAVWLILSAAFLVDASFTLLRRLMSGQRWTEAHRSHAYQHASTWFGGHRPVTLAVWAINLAWLLPLAIGACVWPEFEVLWLMLAYLPLLGIAVFFKAGCLQGPEPRGASSHE